MNTYTERRCNPLPKPRIRKVWGMDKWLCMMQAHWTDRHDSDQRWVTGLGPTPEDAYRRWRIKMMDQDL